VTVVIKTVVTVMNTMTVITMTANTVDREGLQMKRLLTQGGEQHDKELGNETDKELGNALAEHLAHRDWANRIAQLQLSGPTLDHGDPRHCCWCFNPARSVSRADSPFAILMSDRSRPIALCARTANTHADHATVAAFRHRRLAQLEGVCVSRVASGVVDVLRRGWPVWSMALAVKRILPRL
jgi:hypothetical protein